jgi:uncharacterized protein
MGSGEAVEPGALGGSTVVAWSKSAPFGAEYVEVTFRADALSADGVAIGSEPFPYRLDYTLRTGPGFVTAEVDVRSRGDGWERRLVLARSTAGAWTAETTSRGDPSLPPPGGDTASFGGALDPDLGLSPLFNSMPVLRHGLHEGGVTDDFLMVWISVPDLSIHPSPQRYTFRERLADGNRLVRFEAFGEGVDFAADVVFDPQGLVVDYPGIGARIR